MKPVLFVTNHVAPNRVGAFDALAQRLPLEVVTFGGKAHHGGGSVPYGRPVDEGDVREIAAGDWRAVICGISGRRALAGAFTGARDKPFVLWTSLWAHPRSAAQIAGYPLTRAIYRRAHAVVTYGEHVSAYVRAKGATNVHVAPQSVDNAFWSAPAGEKAPAFEVLFVGRDDPAKGLHVLKEAWPEATVVTGGASPEELRNFYARAHVLVVPSLRTRTFREPWGLVVNEAMNQRTAIIASDEVGAAAGGLVRHERNGLVVAAGDTGALRTAIARLRDDPATTARMGDQGHADVQSYTHDAWAAGFEAALRDC